YYRDNQQPTLPLNPEAKVFVPQNYVDNSIMSDFTRYLLKKDLLLSRLSCFDDRPENFRTWKLSFQTVMSELQGNALEEIDLLLKYAGSESRKHIL
ncbi:hypothetical protein, partial [Klebsiella pneumoniae]|uniref:hypothetical protein n=1 Tax=Klebsiella pneumoniae TaxID=573 RepID=UPI003EBCFE00